MVTSQSQMISPEPASKSNIEKRTGIAVRTEAICSTYRRQTKN